MEIALIISLIALAVALPGCIADSLTVIEKIRARWAQRALLKKSEAPPVQQEFRFPKKVNSPRPIQTVLKKVETYVQKTNKKSPAKYLLRRTSVILTHPDVDHFAHRAFLKTLAR